MIVPYEICQYELLVRVDKTHWQGLQDPSKSVPIFLRGTEANFKMVLAGD